MIPVPVLGAVVGNTVGTMMYQIAKNNLSSREQKIFEEYVEAVHYSGRCFIAGTVSEICG